MSLTSKYILNIIGDCKDVKHISQRLLCILRHDMGINVDITCLTNNVNDILSDNKYRNVLLNRCYTDNKEDITIFNNSMKELSSNIPIIYNFYITNEFLNNKIFNCSCYDITNQFINVNTSDAELADILKIYIH